MVKSKYHAKKTEIDGIVFDSKAEANYYLVLKEKQDKGEISQLELQPKYELIPAFEKNGKKYRKTEYRADFKYFDETLKKWIVTDVKGMETDVFKLKHKLFEYMNEEELTIVK